MSDEPARWREGVWKALLLTLSAGRTVPKVHVKDLCQQTGVPVDRLADVMKDLIDLGAVSVLPENEVAAISAGRGLPGDAVIVNGLPHWFFLRVAEPESLQIRLVAQRVLLEKRLAEESILPATEAAAIAAEIGLSPDQLKDALSYELTQDDWELMSNMPATFFRSSWKRMDEQGNATGQMKIAATLARLHVGESLTRASVQAQIDLLTHYIEFLDRIQIDSDASARSAGREPIPETVRHEVWRRDQGRCVQCGSQERLEFDHVIPVSKGGANTARNLQLLCETCNRAKAAHV